MFEKFVAYNEICSIQRNLYDFRKFCTKQLRTISRDDSRKLETVFSFRGKRKVIFYNVKENIIASKQETK